MPQGAVELSSDIEEEEKGGLQGKLRAEAKAGVRGWEEAGMEGRQRCLGIQCTVGKGEAKRGQVPEALWASRRV